MCEYKHKFHALRERELNIRDLQNAQNCACRQSDSSGRIVGGALGSNANGGDGVFSTLLGVLSPGRENTQRLARHYYLPTRAMTWQNW